MITTTKLSIAVIGALVSAFGGFVAPVDARSAGPTTSTFQATEAGPTITISNEGSSYSFAPAQLEAKAGQEITVTNTDPNGVHSVTASDRSFSVDVPPKSSVTFSIDQPGNYPYKCTYHPESHNPASINVT